MADTVYILMGSNEGDRERNLALAREHVENIPGIEITASSSIYISEAVDMEGENPSFLNQVVQADFEFPPIELLLTLEKIEEKMGRRDKGLRKPRPIDLDILLFGDQVIETERLTVPHKELLNRGFAMIPLAEIDDTVVHPVSGKLVVEHITPAHREAVMLYRDHVARNI